MKKFLCLFFVFLCCFSVFGCAEKCKNDAKIINVEEIVINKSHAYCDKGNKIVLLAQVYPFNANNQNIIWKSDNQEIATVDDGVVEAKNEGRTVIKAISEDGNFCDSCILFVSSPKLNYDQYQNNLTANTQIINQNYDKNFNQNFSEKYDILNENYDNFSEKYDINLNNKGENLHEINENLSKINENFIEKLSGINEIFNGNLSKKVKNINEVNKVEHERFKFLNENSDDFYAKNQYENDFFVQFNKLFEVMQNQIYTIKNNILNNLLQKKLENVENFNENDVKIVENKKIINNENKENGTENDLQNGVILQENEKLDGISKNLNLKTEDVNLDEIAENQNHGYFFEYKFNSNGIDEDADEFTNFINDKEILREYEW